MASHERSRQGIIGLKSGPNLGQFLVGRKAVSVEAINERLKAGGHPVRVQLRGRKLVLRAILPPKPGETKWSRRRVTVAPDSVEGLKVAEARALQMASELARNAFNWLEWERDRGDDRPELVKVLEAFKAHRFTTSAIQEQTWARHWQKTFERLGGLDVASFMAVVESYPPDTHGRRRACQHLSALAQFAGIELDLSPYRGSYNPTGRNHQSNQKVPDDLPSDDELVAIAHSIKNEPWRNYFVLSMVYGLRTHEAHYLRLNDDDDRSAYVREGKTGSRTCYPLEPHWLDEFAIAPGLAMPNISASDYRKIGSRFNQQRKRYGVPFVPRTLRYCYVVRAVIKHGYKIPQVAQWMGHTPSTLLNTYARFINKDMALEEYRSKLYL